MTLLLFLLLPHKVASQSILKCYIRQSDGGDVGGGVGGGGGGGVGGGAGVVLSVEHKPVVDSEIQLKYPDRKDENIRRYSQL